MVENVKTFSIFFAINLTNAFKSANFKKRSNMEYTKEQVYNKFGKLIEPEIEIVK